MDEEEYSVGRQAISVCDYCVTQIPEFVQS